MHQPERGESDGNQRKFTTISYPREDDIVGNKKRDDLVFQAESSQFLVDLVGKFKPCRLNPVAG